MKKTIAIILLLCIMLQSAIIVNAADAVEASTDYSKELFVFEYLGALKGKGEIDTSKEISRGEFVDILAKALDLPTENGNRVYYDVDKESLYFGAVAYFSENGVLSVDADREFRPNDTILYGEALKILLTLSGYEEYISANGGYPLGYVMTAKRFGVDMPKANDDALSFGEAMKLILDVATMGVYDLRMVGNDSRHYAVNSKDTLLYIYRDLLVGRGTTETTPIFSMTSNTSENGSVFIDGVEYDVYNEFNITGLEGNYIEFIYEDTSDTDKLIYAEPIRNKNDLYITSEQYAGFDSNSFTLTYYNDLTSNKKTSVSISKSWTVVFNGRKYDGALSKAFEGFTTGERKGTVEIKKGYDGSDAVLIIKSYRRYIVSNFDLSLNTLYNKFDSADAVNLEKYSSHIIRKKTGEKVSKEEIEAESALLIAESKNDELLDVLVADRKVSAAVSYIDTSNKRIRTEDETFEIDAIEWERVKNIIEIGSLYTISIDAFGDVAYMNLTKKADSIMLGYIANSSIKSMLGVTEVTVKMFTQNGDLQVLKLAEKITVDGILFQGNKIVKALYAIPETETLSGMTLSEAEQRPEKIRIKKQLVRYKTNLNGDINYIDTYNVNYDGGETKETSLTKYKKRFELLEYRESTTKRFDRDVLYNASSTKIFNVPWCDDDGYMIKGLDTWKMVEPREYQVDNLGNKKKENDKMYSMGGSFTDYKYYNIDVYNYDANNPYADVIVNHDDFVGGGLYAQVCDIYQTVDEDGNIGHGIKVIGSRGEGTYFVELDADITGLNIGDIIYGTAYGEYMYYTYKIFDCQTRSFVNSSSSVDYWYKGNRTATTDEFRQQNQFSKGIVTDVTSNCVFWKYNMADLTSDYDEAADLSLIKFTIYERNGKGEPVVEIGTTDRIKEYSAAGDDASYMVCLSDLNRTVYAFVFNGR